MQVHNSLFCSNKTSVVLVLTSLHMALTSHLPANGFTCVHDCVSQIRWRVVSLGAWTTSCHWCCLFYGQRAVVHLYLDPIVYLKSFQVMVDELSVAHATSSSSSTSSTCSLDYPSWLLCYAPMWIGAYSPLEKKSNIVEVYMNSLENRIESLLHGSINIIS